MVGREKSEWTKERIERLKGDAIREIENGVYHTLDQVCIVGRKDGGAGDKHIDDDSSIVLIGYSLAFRAVTNWILHHVDGYQLAGVQKVQPMF